MHFFYYRMLNKLIRESFFNPVLHFLPVFVFLIVEESAGLGYAWMFSLPIVLLVGAYIRFMYDSIFQWYLVSVGYFFLITLTSTVLTRQFPLSLAQPIFTEIVLLVLLVVLFFIRKRITDWVTSITPKKVAMMNNLSEMIRFSVVLMVMTSVYIIVYMSLSVISYDRQVESIRFLHQLYHFSLILIVLYQSVRVFAIRHKLMKEEWWPIVNQHGKEIGSIHYHNSLWIEPKKHMHPVVRILVMEGTRILLHQNSYAGDSGTQQWDNALHAHVKYGETVSECIRRVGDEFYGTTHISPVFLTNYRIENSCEYQYVHLFVSGRIEIQRMNPAYSLHLKWWTLNQICEELHSGIFTDNFIKEYELLMRSGLIDESSCTCECDLRETVHQKKTLA